MDSLLFPSKAHESAVSRNRDRHSSVERIPKPGKRGCGFRPDNRPSENLRYQRIGQNPPPMGMKIGYG